MLPDCLESVVLQLTCLFEDCRNAKCLIFSQQLRCTSSDILMTVIFRRREDLNINKIGPSSVRKHFVSLADG